MAVRSREAVSSVPSPLDRLLLLRPYSGIQRLFDLYIVVIKILFTFDRFNVEYCQLEIFLDFFDV